MGHLVVIIPGLFGSKLTTKENVQIWPPSWFEYLRGQLYEWRFNELISNEDLNASDILRTYYLVSIYKKLIHHLEKNGYSKKYDEVSFT